MSPFPRRVASRLLMDLSPLRSSRDFRALLGGQTAVTLGIQLITVAVPYQVYVITRSSLQVGLVSLVQVVPLILGSLYGGSLADSVDRRKILMLAGVLGAGAGIGLAVNADLGTAIWPLFVFPAVLAALNGAISAARGAMVPGMVGLRMVPAANALFQSLNQFAAVAGPAAAGLLLAGAGVNLVYWLNVATFGASVLTAARMSAQRPTDRAGVPGWRSVAEGLRFVRRSQTAQGAYLIDINAMVFGMPQALFPAIGIGMLGGGAATVGLLYAAPGAGALLGAVTAGWVGRIQRQGRAVIVAVIIWGASITVFGLVRWLPLALVLLAVAGWADVISAVFRNTIIQYSGPDEMRGRLMGVQMAVVAGGPRLGNAESGAVASAFGTTASVVSGGLACIAGALILARLLPEFRRQRVPHSVTGDSQSHAPGETDSQPVSPETSATG